MNLTLNDRKVLVTGGGRGIGRAVCLALAGAGADVTACYRSDEESAAELARQLKRLGGDHHVMRADVTVPADVAALAEHVRVRHGRLDAVVNNAGVDAMAPLAVVGEEEWRHVVDTDLTSVFQVTQAVLPLLAEGASIITVGSAAAERGVAMRAHYGAAKAALTGLTRSLAKELGGRRIRVNLVAPGIVETEPGAGLPEELFERFTALTPLGRLARPEDVAGAVVFLASDLSRFVNGVTITVDGGI
ncbi:SDR family NAD(P)-dependent oxidoreductase [Nonomuraea sp. NPDC050783]|uniref:SDR family NAD(P)-dependent oxidoreductase n=1 Tax=Nonomuraea sp. NPDC050783 TaxID=3154634 RepID=UPI0034652484